MPIKRFFQGRRFHIQTDLGDTCITQVHVPDLGSCRVLYQCLAHDEESGRLDMYMEMSGSIRTLPVETFFENIVGAPVRCSMLRTHRQSRRVWSFIRSLENRTVSESGEHSFLVRDADKPPQPATVAEASLVAERADLKRRIAAVEKNLAKRLAVPPPSPPPLDMLFALEFERSKATQYAEMYWRDRLRVKSMQLMELHMEKGGVPKEVGRSARDAFVDLKRQMSIMDNALNEKMFTLFDLRQLFDLHREQLVKLEIEIGTWEEWTAPACDGIVQREVTALRVRLLELEKAERVPVAVFEHVDVHAEMRKASGSAPSLMAECARSASLKLEAMMEEVRAEYDAIDVMYCQDGLKAVLLDLHVRAACLDRQIRRAKECCARFGALLHG